jgi:hypothetical protein
LTNHVREMPENWQWILGIYIEDFCPDLFDRHVNIKSSCSFEEFVKPASGVAFVIHSVSRDLIEFFKNAYPKKEGTDDTERSASEA